MPQLEQTYTYVSQIFWLIVSFSILYLVMRHILIPRLLGTLDARANQVAADLERASTARQDAVEVLNAYERVMREAHEQSNARVNEVFDRYEQMNAQEIENLQKDLDDKFEQAQLRIDQAYRIALAEIEEQVQPVIHAVLSKTSEDLVTVGKTRIMAEIRQGQRR